MLALEPAEFLDRYPNELSGGMLAWEDQKLPISKKK